MISNSTLLRHIDALENHAAKLLEKEYLSEAPKLFCRTIIKLAGFVKPRVSFEDVKTADEVLKILAECLRFVESSQVPNIPWSFVPVVERFFSQITNEKAHFLIRPQWSYNYTLWSRPLSLVAHALEGLTQSFKDEDELRAIVKDSIHVVSFPRLEVKNVLLHAALGHELGHAITDNLAATLSASKVAPHKETIRATLEAEIRLRSNLSELSLSDQSEINERTCLCEKLLKRALEEALADFIGSRLFGPAALFALFDIAMVCPSLDTSPMKGQHYPPWRMRLRLILEELKPQLDKFIAHLKSSGEKGLAASLQARIEEISSVASSAPTTFSDFEVVFAYKLFEDCWENVKQEADALGAREHYFSIEDEASNLIELTDLFSKFLPASQYGGYPNAKPAGFRTILNAAWLRSIALEAAATSEEEYLKNLKVLQRLTNKAIETASVHEKWLESFPEGVS